MHRDESWKYAVEWYLASLQGHNYIFQVMKITRFRSWDGYKEQRRNVNLNFSLNQSEKKKEISQWKWDGVAISKEKLTIKNFGTLNSYFFKYGNGGGEKENDLECLRMQGTIIS